MDLVFEFAAIDGFGSVCLFNFSNRYLVYWYDNVSQTMHLLVKRQFDSIETAYKCCECHAQKRFSN